MLRQFSVLPIPPYPLMAVAYSAFFQNLLGSARLVLHPRLRETGRSVRFMKSTIEKEQKGLPTSYSISSDPTSIPTGKPTWQLVLFPEIQ